MSFSSNTTTTRKVFINNDRSKVNDINHALYNLMKNDNRFHWRLSSIRKLLIKASELIDKRQCLSDQPCLSSKQQSVSWLFINKTLELELDSELLTALNKLLNSMGMAFEYTGMLAAEGIDLTAIDVARDINTTMNLLDIPISFHPAAYGRPEAKSLRNRTGKSSLRRPIAKAELVLSWAAYLLRLVRPADRFTSQEVGFINLLGTLLNVFVQRYELIINVKYHQPCLDQLVFIRLMEIVYINTINQNNKEINVYGSWYDQPDRFNYIDDFNDIRLSADPTDVRSHLSYLPRMISMHPQGKTLYYNPVKCLDGSPVALATKAWIEAQETMRKDDSFKTIVNETAKASFGYESQFVAHPGESLREIPEWKANIRTFELTDMDDVKLYENQLEAIREHLTPIKNEIDNLMGSFIDSTDEPPAIIFSVLLKSNESDKLELSFIQL